MLATNLDNMNVFQDLCSSISEKRVKPLDCLRVLKFMVFKTCDSHEVPFVCRTSMGKTPEHFHILDIIVLQLNDSSCEKTYFCKNQ